MPITSAILHRLLLTMPTTAYVQRAFSTLAFAGFLRTAEFTSDAKGFSPLFNVTRGSVTFVPSLDAPTHLILRLPASKTDPFRHGVDVLIAAAPLSASCPVRAMQDLFRHHPLPLSAPLFQLPDGSHLTRAESIRLTRSSLLAAGEDPSLYLGHSWRRGAATTAAAAGFTEHDIQVLGRWSSDSYKLYIQSSSSRILFLNSQLHHRVLSSAATPFDPLSLPAAALPLA